MGGTALEKLTDIPSHEPVKGSPEDLRQELRDKKEAIAETLHRLDRRVQRMVDWRAQVGDHPFLALGLAVSAGCLVSGVFKRTASAGNRIVEGLAEGVEDITDQVRNRIDSQLGRRTSGGVLMAAVATLATKAATAYLRHKLGNASRARSASLQIKK